MKPLTGTILLGTFFVLIVTPPEILTDSVPSDDAALRHEKYELCGSPCEFSCDTRYLEYLPCKKDCKTGFFCVDGYVRKYLDGPCILPTECPQ